MTHEELIKKLDGWAQEARSLAHELQSIEAVPGETWVSADGLAGDLEDLAHELRFEAVAS